MAVKIWEQKVNIPTYGVGDMDKNPMFLEKRVYQGSSGRVYPYPVIDKILDHKEDQEHLIIFLENEYLQIQVMPDIGGRIYRALDKTNNYDFVYYNEVIKPALVGLAGPWISGGIEFNWPQHHRPNTYGPVEYVLDESNPDRKTVWLAEHERMYGTKVTTGITLREGIAAIEVCCELYNPTAEPQTFLWWANPAVAVHDETQSIFPPDVHAVMDHGKRDVSRFPIATGTYYKMDYSKGVDISRYKNIPVPTSYMAYHSDFDFVGGYDYRAEAGLMHVADHHISPGKKQWTWGSGDFGHAWDRQLTDENGPYIELMTGVFTDNQPDFTWLQPYAGKSFTQYFMPYKKIGEVKCANKDILAGLEVKEGQALVRVYASRMLDEVHIRLSGDSVCLIDVRQNLSPIFVFEHTVDTSLREWELTLTIEADGVHPLRYTPEKPEVEKLPAPAEAIGAPETLSNTEALFLAGLHLEQYRHATYEPDAYYREGLRRDKGDIRLNNAYGNLLLRRGQFSEAQKMFETAKRTATRHNPNPYDGEVFYSLGKALELQGRDDEAYDAYYKAVWSDAWRTQGMVKLAQIAARQGRCDEALEHAREAVYAGYKNYKARAVLTILARSQGLTELARQTAAQTLLFDPLDFAALRETALLAGNTGTLKHMRGKVHNYITLAWQYAELGLYGEALQVVEDYLEKAEKPYAMSYYYRAWLLHKLESPGVQNAWQEASRADSSYCFPSSLKDYIILRQAIHFNPDDAKAYYYLGCFLYDKKRHDDAKEAWERSAALDSSFATVHRNLALYYANKGKNWDKARECLERAFALDEGDARVFYELCELYRRTGMPLKQQRNVMQRHYALVELRDDLSIAYIDVLNGLGEHERVIELLLNRKFHPWEGGEGKVPRQHIRARIGLAKRLMRQERYAEAVEHLYEATVYRENFGEGKLISAQENDIYYYLGLAYKPIDLDKSAACFEKAASGQCEPTSALYYNDQPPYMIYYQGKALLELGRMDEARSRFNKLVAYGEAHLYEPQTMDYFAVSLPDFLVFETDLDEKNKTQCYTMMGYGFLGLKKREKARESFTNALALSPGHPEVTQCLQEMEEVQ